MYVLNILAYLLLAGLIPTLWLMPKVYLKYSFFIAPVIGLIVIASLSLLMISLLYLPFSPGFLSSLLFFTFFITALLKRKELTEILYGIKENYTFLLIPIFIIFLLIISPHDLLETFYSAGQDEIQYVNNSIHILQYQNTGDLLDTLIPRVDHYLRDAQTINLVYSPSYRRGAEIFLAYVMYITGLNPFVCFTVSALTALIVFILAIPAICHAFLKLNKRLAIACQLIIILSHFWIILILQGSLANLCTLGIILLAATAIPKLYTLDGYKSKILIGLLISGPIIFYNEIAAPLILGPLLLIFIYSLLINKKIIQQFKNLGVIFVSIVSFSHVGLIGLAWMTYGMISKTSAEAANTLTPFSLKQFTEIQSAFFGIFTYYSTSYTNAISNQLVSNHPALILLCLFVLYLLAIYAFLRKRSASTCILGIILIVLLAVTLHSALHSLHFMVVRSTQYAYVYIVIGLVIFYATVTKKYLKIFAASILIFLLLINIKTLYSSLDHLIKFDERSDPIVFRFPPNSSLWINFLKEVKSHPDSPLLITGYNSTAKPMLIASLVEPNPNFIGASVRNFWAMMPIDSPKPSSALVKKIKYFHDIQPTDTVFIKIMKFFFPAQPRAKEELLDQLPYSLDTVKGVKRMNQDSIMAVLMVGSPDPEEWEEKRLIARHRNRYFPIGDVISKDKWSGVLLKINGDSLTKLNNSLHENSLIDITLPLEPRIPIDLIEIQLETKISRDNLAIEPKFLQQVKIAIINNTIQFKPINHDLNNFSFYLKNISNNKIVSITTVNNY